MKLKVDENLPIEVADLLGEAGHDARTVRSQALSGASDHRVLETCRTESRALVTLDQGFADIVAYPPAQSPDLIVLRPRRQSKSHVLDIVRRLVPLLATEPLERHLWVVDEVSVRIRGKADA